MAKSPTITPEVCRQLLRYEADTGLLFWLPRSDCHFTTARWSSERARKIWNSQYAGREAFQSVGSDGYRYGRIFQKLYPAHRIIWLMVHGHWPTIIDHINHDRTDNRISNLRNVTRHENHRNYRLTKQTASGHAGVTFHKPTGMWMARIGVGEKHMKLLGYFKNLEDAVAVRKAAEVEHGYHPNHARLA